ncbi:hypothetical protein BDD12DRAFT_788718 [Trichophaea hybrida]|nr:hypothetical protein BDD12DRAFT_788718 [Trichophaea hybrida]
MATQYSNLIDELHRQILKGRTITITKDPALHLVWYYNTVYIKPVPQCLLNYAFWKTFLCTPAAGELQKSSTTTNTYHLKAALGYLCTYSILIKHSSDFQLVIDNHLLPKCIDWISFSKFIASFRELPDEAVSLRYRYGQLRLTRLNFAVRIFRPSKSQHWWSYHERHWQIGQYLNRFITPLLFIFGSMSIILAAMQVVFNILAMNQNDTKWEVFASGSLGFSMASILGIVMLWGVFIGGVFVLLMFQLGYAIRLKRRREKEGHSKKSEVGTAP